MDPIIASMIVSGGVALAGRIIGNIAAAGDRELAAKYREMALKQYGDAVAPQLDKVVFDTQGKTNLRNEDPRMRDSQVAAMDYLQGQGAGSLDAVARGDLAESQSDAARFNRGLQGQLSQQMAARGLRGSGLEYLGQQMGVQGASESMYQSNTRAASDQAQRRMDAIKSAAGIASGVRGQDMQVNRAQDEIDRFNVESLNRGKQYNAGLSQKNFDNDMRVRGAKAGAYRDASQDYANSANQTEDAWSGGGQDASNTAASVGSYLNETDGKKKKG